TLLSGSEKLRLREVFTSAWDSESLLGYIRTYVFVRFSSPHGHREMYSPELNSEKCDSLAKGYISELWDFTCISVTQNSLQELKEIWDQWNEEWVTARIQQKGGSKCILWKSLKDIILAYPDTKKRVDVFALSIYGLVIFPKALGHIDEAVTDLFD
ncbi:hypothetical protein Gotur_001454, partial [Gossypium turneri]